MTNMFRVFVARMTLLAADESGMSTVEYSIVSIYTHYWRDPILVRAYRDIKY